MVQTTIGSSLVGGATAASQPVQTIHIRVVRSFLYAGSPLPAGSVVEVPAPAGLEFIAMGKAVRVESDAISATVAEIPVEPLRPRRGRPPKTKE